jgi:excisionase family DNA binding protein
MGTLSMPEPRLRVVGKLFTYSQAALILGVRPQTLRLWAMEGKLTTITIGPRTVRVPESALNDLVAAGFAPGSHTR